MDPISKCVLDAYDELGCEVLNLSVFADFVNRVGLNVRDELPACVEGLVERGWLRLAGPANAWARTEDGRLALAGPRDVTLYTRPGCHLCEEAKAQMSAPLREFGARLFEVNIDADPVLRERYTNDVPVIFLGERKVAKHRVNVTQLRRLLAAAVADSQ
ncbi:MAG TPA: glutaredoxin family protein [Candidatus Acidoferrales bacterium]|nr:glutaredoxin family protein [Candidatus Acidoferrales bacterium]